MEKIIITKVWENIWSAKDDINNVILMFYRMNNEFWELNVIDQCLNKTILSIDIRRKNKNECQAFYTKYIEKGFDHILNFKEYYLKLLEESYNTIEKIFEHEELSIYES